MGCLTECRHIKIKCPVCKRVWVEKDIVSKWTCPRCGVRVQEIHEKQEIQRGLFNPD